MAHNKDQKDTDRLLGQVMELIRLIEYQEGSVVSRTIIDKATGTLTLFAFDDGQGLSANWLLMDLGIVFHMRDLYVRLHNSSDCAISSHATQSVTIIEANPFRGATLLEHTLLK